MTSYILTEQMWSWLQENWLAHIGSNSIWPFLSPQFKTCFKSWLNSEEHCARLLKPKWISCSLLDYCSPYLVQTSNRKLPYCATTAWYHGWELRDSRSCVLFFMSHASETLPVTTKVNNLTHPHSHRSYVGELWKKIYGDVLHTSNMEIKDILFGEGEIREPSHREWRRLPWKGLDVYSVKSCVWVCR